MNAFYFIAGLLIGALFGICILGLFIGKDNGDEQDPFSY